jgi:hypothetical protein
VLGFEEGSIDCFEDGCWDGNKDGPSLGVKLKLLGAPLLLPGKHWRHDNLGYQIPNVTIADGAHKYVLISALLPGGRTSKRQHFVCS